MAASPLFARITIIGLGLIGSSVARAARAHHLAASISGYDHNEVTLAFARKGGFIDLATSDLKAAVKDSKLIVLATPPSTLGDIAEAIAPYLRPGCIVMDVCSVKQAAIAAIAPHIPDGVHFMPAHPIAGSEHSGVSAGRADLFDRKRVIVTPSDPALEEQILQQVTSFWKGMGARMEAMPPHLHDMIYAYVSHLPQLLAFAAGTVLENETDEQSDVLTKFLRLSASNPDMWIDIFLLNKDNILKALDRYLDAVLHILKEFSDAPEGTVSESDEKLARTALFPRIAASCLITTVMEAEKKAGFPLARYAGTGFADFTYPASQPPEGDIESISNQYQVVAVVLRDYIAQLKALRAAIDSGDADNTEKALVTVQ